MPSAKETAARLRAARGYAGLTQRKLASLMGTSVETLSRIENGRRTATAEEIERIVALCDGVPMEFIRTGFALIAERGRTTAQVDVVERLATLEEIVMGLARRPTTDDGRARQDALLRGLETLLHTRAASQPSPIPPGRDVLGDNGR